MRLDAVKDFDAPIVTADVNVALRRIADDANTSSFETGYSNGTRKLRNQRIAREFRRLGVSKWMINAHHHVKCSGSAC
jgi:hypothetical protein